jgi:hypothetical protein
MSRSLQIVGNFPDGTSIICSDLCLSSWMLTGLTVNTFKLLSGT